MNQMEILSWIIGVSIVVISLAFSVLRSKSGKFFMTEKIKDGERASVTIYTFFLSLIIIFVMVLFATWSILSD